ncbi:MAG TPA: NUDIX hydrolase [Thermoanaerobaculia bacterium]
MTHQIFEGKRILVLERDGWEYVERKKATEAVAVIAMTEDDEVILTEQYRRPVDARVIDWPAGLVGDDGENDPAATAKKELEEESGFRCERVELLARGPSSPGITSEIVTFYRAYGVTHAGKGGGVEGEKITVHVVPRAKVEKWLREREREGLLVDLKLWGGLHFVTTSA